MTTSTSSAKTTMEQLPHGTQHRTTSSYTPDLPWRRSLSCSNAWSVDLSVAFARDLPVVDGLLSFLDGG